MDLVSQYQHQYRWRSWQQAYELLPPLGNSRVLDLGCAIGDQSRDLAARGAQVLGIDGNAELVGHARAHRIAGATFEVGDIRSPTTVGLFDGIWASFVAAYFPSFPDVLARWRALLRPGGWIALTEVCGMFEHSPLPAASRKLLDSYVCESREVGRYDFDMGSGLNAYLEDGGFKVEVSHVLPDRELSFAGAADADVLQAWTSRLERMRLLRERALHEVPSFQQDLVACLSSPSHTTDCRVHFCVGRMA